LRGVPRWLAVLAVLAVVAVVCAFTVHRALAPAALDVQLSSSSIPADGFSSSELTVRSRSGHDLRGVHLEVDTQHQVILEDLSVTADSVTASLRAGVVPGGAKVRISGPGFTPEEVRLTTTPDNSDRIGDGTPDFLRLHDPGDRRAFRRWFTLLAESQFYRAQPMPEVDDCAALIRFAYREALREHDRTWAHAVALPAPVSAGDIRQYQYPYTPLAAEIFRVKDGPFTSADLRNGSFAQFADAETMWRHNTFSVGRNLAHARPGDLLFFRQDGGHMPFHAMTFIGRSQVEPSPRRADTGDAVPTPQTGRAGDLDSGREQFVVYHTGPDGKAKGIVKRLSLPELMNYPDPRWRPVASNPAFVGVYRWNILRGGE
jgi:uncharacterized protein